MSVNPNNNNVKTTPNINSGRNSVLGAPTAVFCVLRFCVLVLGTNLVDRADGLVQILFSIELVDRQL